MAGKDGLMMQEEVRRKLVALGRDPDAVASKAELDEARRKIGQMMERDGELVLALAENERLGKRVVALEQALADRAAHFEGMPCGNVILLGGEEGKEEGE